MSLTNNSAKQFPSSRAEEFALLVDSVSDYAIFLLSPEGEILSWNSGASRIMGYDEAEAVGRHFSMFYGPDDLASEKPRQELEIAESEGRVEDEGWRIRKDGQRFWANTVITSLKDTQGRVWGFAKVTRDMTLRREAEEQLRQSTEIFKLLVSSVRDYAIFMLDPEGYVSTWNDGARRIKGYAPEEIIGRHFSTFYGDEDLRDRKPERELEIARRDGRVEDEGWRLRKDGTRFWANVVITAVYDKHGELRGFAKVTRDITERKLAEETRQALLEQREARLQAEEERRRAEASYRAAREANRAKDEFLMTLSHELRTPMTAILGWARMLQTMTPDDPLFNEAVDSIAGGAQLQARLIDDLLDVSRIAAGKLRLAPEMVDIGRIVRSSIDAVAPTADAKRIRISATLPPDLGSLVVDPTRIHQVIWNLLSNAVKFTPRQGNVAVVARRTESQVEIAVRDDGEGIDPRFLPHIFEPFRQAESPQTRVHGGLGLGLSIVRHIAEAHGGTVTAESDGRGHGATFTVILPVSEGSEAPSTRGIHDARVLRDRLRGVEIDLVEDDPESRKVVAAVLRAAGAKLRTFESANDALQAIEQHRPHVIITDIAMPELDGYAFARALTERNLRNDLRLVALSAFPLSGEAVTEFDAYLTKPIDPFKLVEDIERLVGA
jgi:PAS domain S-box-containing protein